MGFLSSLFGKKKRQEPSVPSVKLRNGLKSSFSVSFKYHISSLSCFADNEIEEMVSFIESVPSGFPNKAAWHNAIYQKYFEPRKWSWPLLEEWRDTLIERGAYWSSKWLPTSKNDFKREEYNMLLSHIESYAKNIDDIKKYAELGASYDLMFRGGDAMQSLAKELHKKNPKAIPPFFPDDRTTTKINLSNLTK